MTSVSESEEADLARCRIPFGVSRELYFVDKYDYSQNQFFENKLVSK